MTSLLERDLRTNAEPCTVIYLGFPIVLLDERHLTIYTPGGHRIVAGARMSLPGARRVIRGYRAAEREEVA